jgi:hypothetical protein
MHRRKLLALAGSSLAFLTLGFKDVGANEYRVSAPIIHENLAIYLVHGRSVPGPVPLTLAEAMVKQAVRVHETGNVSELQIENLGTDEVFVQAGDIVKGGKQDRVLTVSLILPPKSGKIAIASLCVEQGRWTARGKEDVTTFATASAAVPSREAKLAMRAPAPVVDRPANQPMTTGIGRGDARIPNSRVGYVTEGSSAQQKVWDNVRKVQQGLSSNLGTTVNAAASGTSLQLALENEKLKDAQRGYITALQTAAEKDGDVVGYIFAINGKLNSAEVYPSNGLFRKMWPKLLDASVTEAIGQKKGDKDATPTGETALAFLDAASKGQSSEKTLTKEVRLETRNAEKAFYFETRRASGGWVHRSYLAK